MSNSKKSGGTKPASKSSGKSGNSNKKSASKADSAIRGARNSSVVSKSGRPWALIGATVAVVVFAAFAVFYAVKATSDKKAEDAANDPTKISGLHTFDYSTAQGAHSNDPVAYKETPPVGGTHNPEWADCTGTVYSVQIKNENAVHSLEHGAVWITYDPTLVDADVIAELEKLASGKDFTFLSPYPNQGSPISLQSWGHQLKVESPTDKRVQKFVDGFRLNPQFTPELGASCQNPTFKASPKQPADLGVPNPSAPTDSTSDAAGASGTQAG